MFADLPLPIGAELVPPRPLSCWCRLNLVHADRQHPSLHLTYRFPPHVARLAAFINVHPLTLWLPPSALSSLRLACPLVLKRVIEVANETPVSNLIYDGTCHKHLCKLAPAGHCQSACRYRSVCTLNTGTVPPAPIPLTLCTQDQLKIRSTQSACSPANAMPAVNNCTPPCFFENVAPFVLPTWPPTGRFFAPGNCPLLTVPRHLSKGRKSASNSELEAATAADMSVVVSHAAPALMVTSNTADWVSGR